ncbi:unnamed protein product [Caenorhabditis sp. 36 PRJEB53466]|nr:unnamed protein product [Caenorhabditis sp. 36 PRJEB53466]
MDCVNCECTVKTMDNLEGAIRALMQRGKHVNRMMDNEKLIREAKKMEEVAELKKTLPTSQIVVETEPEEESTVVNSDREKKRRLIYNKRLRAAESIDFDIPSLNYETSSSYQPTTSAVISIPEKTCPSSLYTKSHTVTTEMTHSTYKKSKSGILALNDHYVVDKDGRSEKLPLKAYVKQRSDGSLDVSLVFFDENGEKAMEISMNAYEKKVQNVLFCGKSVKSVD